MVAIEMRLTLPLKTDYFKNKNVMSIAVGPAFKDGVDENGIMLDCSYFLDIHNLPIVALSQLVIIDIESMNLRRFKPLLGLSRHVVDF